MLDEMSYRNKTTPLPAVTIYPIDDIYSKDTHWIAIMGDGDGFCGTGETPSAALSALAGEMNRASIRNSGEWLIQEARRRAGKS